MDDESHVLTWSSDGTARLWDSGSGVPITPPLPHDPRAGRPIIDPAGKQLRTWTLGGGLCIWDLTVDIDWPIGDWSLRVEAETGSTLTPIGELKVLSPTDWSHKRFCQYDAIRHKMGSKRISDAEWAESQRRCKALDQADQPPSTTTAGAKRNADAY